MGVDGEEGEGGPRGVWPWGGEDGKGSVGGGNAGGKRPLGGDKGEGNDGGA